MYIPCCDVADLLCSWSCVVEESGSRSGVARLLKIVGSVLKMVDDLSVDSQSHR